MLYRKFELSPGVGPVTYWVSNFVWDMCNFLLPTSVCVSVFYVFQQDAYVKVGSLYVIRIILDLFNNHFTLYIYSNPSMCTVLEC